MRFLDRWMSALPLCLLIAGSAFGQLTTGGIRGTVRDPAGGTLPGVTVELTAPVLQGTRLEVTDVDGAFAFASLPPGDGYAVTATLEGFRSVRAGDIHVYLGKQGTIAVAMQPAITEEIVVIAPASPLIDVTSATTGINVTAKQYDALPTRRTFQELTAMAPGISLELGERRPELATSPSVAGGTALENNYLIEGISTTEVMQGGSGTNVTMNFVEEIQVMTGAMSAEFGRSLGGIFNVVTKSGGNDFAGDLFAYYQSDDWSSTSVRRRFRETSSKANGIDSRDIGFAIGGPIRRDRLWFFAAWDPTRKTTYTRDFVDASGAFVEAEREFDTDTDLFAGKLTWALSPRHQVVATAFGDPTTKEGWLGQVRDDPTVALQRNVIGSVNYVARYDGWFRERASLEARFGTHRASDDLEATTEIGRTVPRQQDYTGARHGGSGYEREQPVSRESIFVKASAPWRNHRLTAGVDVQDSLVDAVASLSYFVFVGRRNFPGGIGPADDMREWTSSYDGYGSVLGAAAFAQDDWDIVPGLRLSAGIRYERQTVDSEGGVMIAEVAGDGSLTERRAGALALDHNWAPRLGVVWDPRRDGRGKLYVHAGRYFEALPAHAAYWGSGQTYSRRGYYSRVAHNPTNWYNAAGSPLNEEWVGLAAAGEGVDETAAEFDPEARMQYQDELRAGGEIQLGAAWSAGAHYVHRWIGRVLDDVGLFLDPADPFTRTGYLITNPGEGKIGSLYADPKRVYDSVELTVQRRPSSDHWFLQSSLVWARAEGDYDGLYRSNNNQVGANLTAYYDHPAFQKNAYGPLVADRPYQVKAFGSYDFPFGLALGGAFLLTAGSPVSALGPEVNYGDYEYFMKPRGSEGRTPAYWGVDLHADYQLRFAPGALSLIVDVFNATDNHEAIMVDQAYVYIRMPGWDTWRAQADVDEYGNMLWNPDLPASPYFKTPILYQSPRTLQVGVKYRF
ncbi:MAG TPA: TonB-dependent receptor [Thermoanaerobaculia bacterium]